MCVFVLGLCDIVFLNTIFSIIIIISFWFHVIFFQYDSALKCLKDGCGIIFDGDALIIYIYLPLTYIWGFSLHFHRVSRDGLSVFLKSFNRIDKNIDCCGAELCDPLLTELSNNEGNLPLLLWDLFLVTLKHFRYAFIPELNQDRCICCEAVCNL